MVYVCDMMCHVDTGEAVMISNKLKIISLVTIRPVAHLGGHPCILQYWFCYESYGYWAGGDHAAIKCKIIHDQLIETIWTLMHRGK